MVPESEYFALMNMLKGGDPMQGEKLMLDTKIQKNLADKKIPAELRAKKHSWLYKRRRQIKELVENRPQKVVIDNPSAIPNIAPYLGIQPPKPKLENELQEKIDHNLKKRIRTRQQRGKNNGIINGSSLSDTSYTSANEESEQPSSSSKIISKLTSSHKTSPKNYNKIMSIVGKNPSKYGVEIGTGKVLTYKNQPVTGSDYAESIKYLTGQSRTPPRGHTFFVQRLSKDPEVLKLFPNLLKEPEQTGTGKQQRDRKNKSRKIVRIKNTIKTPGLVREKFKRIENKSFKPMLWAKL